MKAMKTILLLALLLAGLTASSQPDTGRQAKIDNCAVCGEKIERVVYFVEDKVAGDKKAVCEKCVALTTTCYLCGLPVKEKYEELSDGRILCARDVKNVVLDDAEAQRIWQDVKGTVERQLSRFMNFSDNVTLHPLDRVDLQAMFQVVGNDYVCPNVWGCTERETNNGHAGFKISLLRGLPPSVLKATCAHELTHTWVSENVSRARKQRMEQDSVEGFCELVAALYCESQNDQAQLGIIKSNAYTRGQFALFREAERQFGLNEIVEWMKYGVDPRLTGIDLTRVRKVEIPDSAKDKPAAPVFAAVPVRATPPPAPETLTLKGIMWSPTRPMAMINDHTFALNEESKVRLGQSNVVVRCVAIRQDAVVIRVGGSSEPQTLTLGKSTAK
ncbi:MAG: protein DA1 [Pedosphaera sp.]|nr:protein DA1 [Pedosphaera sp.]